MYALILAARNTARVLNIMVRYWNIIIIQRMHSLPLDKCLAQGLIISLTSISIRAKSKPVRWDVTSKLAILKKEHWAPVQIGIAHLSRLLFTRGWTVVDRNILQEVYFVEVLASILNAFIARRNVEDGS